MVIIVFHPSTGERLPAEDRIKEKKEQQRRAEEQRMLRTSPPEEHYSGEKISEMLARLRLEEAKGAGERERRRAKERQRYREALPERRRPEETSASLFSYGS